MGGCPPTARPVRGRDKPLCHRPLPWVVTRKASAAEPRPTRPLPDLYHAARRGGFHQTVGFRVVVAQSGRGFCTVAGRVKRQHLNINGLVHGGVYATILDTAMGAAVLSLLTEEETAATTSLYVEFLSAARAGDTLTARGHVLRRGRHIAFAEGDLFGADGHTLSQARGTWYIWSAAETPRSVRAATRRRTR